MIMKNIIKIIVVRKTGLWKKSFSVILILEKILSVVSY